MLNRQLRSNEHLASIGMDLHPDHRLCPVHERQEPQEPQRICSLGLFEEA